MKSYQHPCAIVLISVCAFVRRRSLSLRDLARVTLHARCLLDTLAPRHELTLFLPSPGMSILSSEALNDQLLLQRLEGGEVFREFNF